MRNMKKLICLLMAVVMVMSLAACGSKDEGTSGAAGVTNLSLATGGTTGTYYGFQVYLHRL